MARRILEKTAFSAGALAPSLYGRGDLAAYANGAAVLQNVVVEPSGGVRRRDGLRFVATLPGVTRLVAFEFNSEQTYLLVLSANRVAVFEDVKAVTYFESPWAAEHLAHLSWTQSADSLLIVHPECPPVRLTRHGVEDWRMTTWAWRTDGTHVFLPFYKFAAADTILTPSGINGTITASVNEDVFEVGHVGTLWRINGVEATLNAVAGPRSATMVLKAALPDAGPTQDFQEAAFSAMRGWPRSVTFHQDRMIIGGSRDLPNRIWMSKSGDLFNFDPGEGLDDEAIEFGLLADQVNAIVAVFAGRHLQVFTSGSEWMVTGDPLTPKNVQITRQTRIGSQTDRNVPPVSIDGATIFAARNGREIREFLFTDVEQAYGAADLALLSGHLINRPRDQAYDADRRLLHVVMTDGSMATLTAYRSEAVTAWSLQKTAGAFRAIAVSGGVVYVVCERAGRFFLECFDASCGFDCASRKTLAEASPSRRHWGDLRHFDGLTLAVWADDRMFGDIAVAGGSLSVPVASHSMMVGFAFEHVIEPLPPVGADGSRPHGGNAVRLIAATLRLHQTASLKIDVGRGLRDVPLRRRGDGRVLDRPGGLFDGDVTVRALGWRRGGSESVWRIAGDFPRPFCLLAVSCELGVND
ncbi:hypothetical protein [Thalassospira sp.]|uniref:hypothetical protein n=1 Tax=Thalassospira sp. TaxID=1912094 RepID=UPI002733FCA8|nr:hypothetical protein [Thalassospira sp.]MDP2697584.1 hypothetical protein [Thalassospira sp.]